MGKESIIACQIGYLPIDSSVYISEIEEVLSIIRTGFPDCEIGEFSTTIKGDSSDVLDLINKIMCEMDGRGRKFNLQISISNICGCIKN